MKVAVTIFTMITALGLGAADAYAFAWGGGRSSSASSSVQSDPTTGATPVPEPSTLYAVGSAIALLGGAGWYIRRRR